MSPRIDRVSRSREVARRIATGEIGETAGAIAILEFAYACGAETANSLADRIISGMPKEAA